MEVAGTITTDAAQYHAVTPKYGGYELPMTVSIQNTTDEDVTFVCGSFSAILFNEETGAIGSWGRGPQASICLEEVKIAPGASYTRTFRFGLHQSGGPSRGDQVFGVFRLRVHGELGMLRDPSFRVGFFVSDPFVISPPD
jgi:hypothetical protein